MLNFANMTFERSRGIVWVCDVEGSSKAFNDHALAGCAEEFLKRLYWLSLGIVDAAEGIFIKWTGDGFLAWFRTDLYRDLGERALRVLSAAGQTTSVVNITQLGVKQPQGHRFRVRHGITFEHDAQLVKLTYPDKHESLDLMGRAVVLAFRLSGIRARFPGIVTQRELVAACRHHGTLHTRFGPAKLGREDVLKHFKGERWGTAGIVQSTDKRRSVSNLQRWDRRARALIHRVEHAETSVSPFYKRYVRFMQSGPNWGKQALKEEARFLNDELLGALKAFVTDGTRPTGWRRRRSVLLAEDK